jgi:hypothetical protein
MPAAAAASMVRATAPARMSVEHYDSVDVTAAGLQPIYSADEKSASRLCCARRIMAAALFFKRLID